jgi:hypothetical protein
MNSYHIHGKKNSHSVRHMIRNLGSSSQKCRSISQMLPVAGSKVETLGIKYRECLRIQVGHFVFSKWFRNQWTYTGRDLLFRVLSMHTHDGTHNVTPCRDVFMYEYRVHYLRFTTDVVLLFSDFVGLHDLWYPRYFKYPSKNEGTDNTVCVSCS